MQNDGATPYANVQIGAVPVPLFVVTFDAAGRLTSPLQLETLLEGVRAGRYSDVHVYSHGWNNTFPIALKKYQSFFTTYGAVCDAVPNKTDLRTTAFLGIIWPSTVLVAADERTPQIAALDGLPDADADSKRLIADALELDAAGRETLDRSDDPFEVAALLAPLFRDPELAADAAADTASIVEIASRASRSTPTRREFGFAGSATAPAALGLPSPRWLVRVATVFLMKDRASTVGALGVGKSVLQNLLPQPIRVHGIGHSFGVAVMLAAVCAAETTPKLRSLLLLQGAISRFCFARDLGDTLGHGAYRGALDRVELPIFATHSDRDRELHDFFHLAVNRRSDYGELRALALFDRYKALGGYGPEGLSPGERVGLDLREAGEPYPKIENARIYALNGSNGFISSHGDVDNRRTAWAHASLVGGGL